MAETRFAQSLGELLKERGWSQRQLAKETQRRDGWGTSPTISWLLRDDLPPTLEAMEAISGALQVDPAIWPEYRMAQWRHDLNPERVGYKAAYASLREIELALG